MSAVLGPERVAQLADERLQQWPAEETWGVWCLHERRWVHTAGFGAAAEREAWQELIQTPSSHPWELRIAQVDSDGRPILTTDDKPKREPCHQCSGSGHCPRCHGAGDCDHCDGSGKEPAK